MSGKPPENKQQILFYHKYLAMSIIILYYITMKYYFMNCREPDLAGQRELARVLFRFALEKEAGITGVDYAKDERGKPYIPGVNLHVSISHCKAGIACVISEHPVGIDVEEVSRINPRIARKICTPEELALLENAEDKQKYLCELWVLKEACFKMTGQWTAAENSRIIKRSGEPLLYIGIASESGFAEEPEEVTFCACP
jgi:phosphopantetheinyl transferase (holo-ACP synthase)